MPIIHVRISYNSVTLKDWEGLPVEKETKMKDFSNDISFSYSGNENTPLKRHRSSTSTISSITSTSSISKQSTLTSFYRRPMSFKYTPIFMIK
ncbi:7556_t:CDS:2, partial [Rhizophagus irregularis]